ncbi:MULTISPECIES: phosphate/phosphite/phosphonate ABC transporter substrate-binding protein [unclassified Roseofilum]|uniref:phosphate/phosphite/phosphonate ABC transporter substrate-binding protein n=1 Tax=unclassified Roseofilum TaxID=2620099 RepID=UPI001B22026D|nr:MULTISPECIES: phosphate/phosphite/phosphonate ABC transporter substrate-binding protein [unclassified Roseofilum]MBP0009213.1 phosphate/phosphite/phosphonate ABC transporter substrate-binding protein [Roseofilum sp. Belize Diploria]MBP0033572.1 phosphate/phosphite/phosphonate ABC transporter substrate-binding protein [Roseofilum sp. Belize BBD 4]
MMSYKPIDFMQRCIKQILLGCLTLITIISCSQSNPDNAQLTELKFGVGPYFPTPGENQSQFEPLFNQLAEGINLKADVTVTEDWVGISEALRSRTLDVAWLGPWGYVLANHNDPSIEAIATVKYKEQPVYYSILMAKADAPFDTLDEAIAQSQNGPKLKLSLADVGSTSGWLIPQGEFKRRGLDPEAVFDYNEGASHAAQAIAVLEGQVDIASDYDRNIDVLNSTGRIDRSQLKIIWQSDPLPNDPIAVRGGLPPELKAQLQQQLANLSVQEAQTLLPENYTGFVPSDGSNYSPIQAAGKSVGKL